MSVIARSHHIGLSVADLDAQQRWYQQALGLDEVVEHFELPEPRVRTVVLRAANGLRIELIEREGSTARTFHDPLEAALTRGYGHWALEVEDLDQTFATLSAVGAESVSPPGPAVQPGARFAYVRDPEGNLLELIQPQAT
ncbi:MAG TPA: VOC family protein [Solirubrobacteraceae bacterium]|jgi:catechol 2,3-dioxygenase-like lactoylglutathione lyase family enzyme|nr:VOC family protein [Solirubrobacteraceae bacterium]